MVWSILEGRKAAHARRGVDTSWRGRNEKLPPKHSRLSKPLIHQVGLLASTDDKPSRRKEAPCTQTTRGTVITSRAILSNSKWVCSGLVGVKALAVYQARQPEFYSLNSNGRQRELTAATYPPVNICKGSFHSERRLHYMIITVPIKTVLM